MTAQTPEPAASETQANALTERLIELLSHVPPSTEPIAENPKARARVIARKAAWKASAVSGTLALPPGLPGMLTVLPDLALVWRIQTRMVADIAAAFGKTSELSPELLLFCLFDHLASDSLRDLVMRVGERYVVRRTTSRVWRAAAGRIGWALARESAGRSLTRFLPLVGAAGVALYVHRDTRRVSDAAIALFAPGDAPKTG